MSNERRIDRPTPRPEQGRGARYQTGGDHYRTGDERRYSPERDRGERGFEGDRRYGQGGYREETGYRQFENQWRNDDDPQYYGTGSHYGGGFGTAPSSRASSSGSLGAQGYAGRGAWSDESDWTPEQESGADTISHRGRGPKGYQRSDERLRETICERLTHDPYIDASDIEVEVKDQSVTLRGTVADRHTKYAVEELVDSCGPRVIQNELTTRPRSW